MTSKVLISLPVYRREWVLPLWLEFVEKQSIGLDNIGFQFELGPRDKETHDILFDWYADHSEVIEFDPQVEFTVEHKEHVEGSRAWRRKDYLRMVALRNSLLDRAVAKLDNYDYFLSLDSDIILESETCIEDLISRDVDIVSPLVYLQSGNTLYPNGMDWDSIGRSPESSKDFHGIRSRKLSYGLNRIDVPMAAILMKPKVIRKHRYVWHHQGEDIGFATQFYFSNIKSYLDTEVYCPHIMHRGDLAKYLKDGDNRAFPSSKATINLEANLQRR